VERQSLSNKQEFEQAALRFELDKLRIEAERDVRIQSANAMGQMLGKAQMQIFGDPDTMAKMSERFMRAASYGTAAEGLLSHLPPQAAELLAKLGTTVASQLADKAPTSGGNGSPPESPKPTELVTAVVDSSKKEDRPLKREIK